MKNIPLYKSPYSYHFNVLTVLGAWKIESSNEKIIKLYAFYKVCATTLAVATCCCLYTDLYLVFGNLKKMTWNLSSSTLFFVSVVKSTICFHHCQTINKLRNDLHKNEQWTNSEDDIEVNAMAFKKLQLLRFCFYGVSGLLIFIWSVSRYFSYLWGPPELLVPMQLPIKYNLEDSRQYNYLFVVFLILTVTGFILVLENEISLLSVLIQISREYSRLLKDIPKINRLFATCTFQNKVEDFTQEVNPSLRKIKAKGLIREVISRQQKLIEYTNAFENSYNKTMLVQVLAVSFIIIVSSIQVFIISSSSPIYVSYLVGYNLIMLLDLYLSCHLATKIRDQCLKVGEEIYFTVWYCMEADVQKDICMIIMRSQRPPKITSGKLMEINLHAFMLMLRNIYSWLTLYKQLENEV